MSCCNINAFLGSTRDGNLSMERTGSFLRIDFSHIKTFNAHSMYSLSTDAKALMFYYYANIKLNLCVVYDWYAKRSDPG